MAMSKENKDLTSKKTFERELTEEEVCRCTVTI